MSIANTDQAEHWNTGDERRSLDRQPGPLRPHARAVRGHDPRRRRAAPRWTVLDVGCGCGGTTLAAARLVAPGEAVGLDLSGPMLARARADAEAAGLGNAAFRQGDAQVHALEPARFDAVMSRFGVMFFADPVAAFENIRSATRPGGRLVFVCWQPLAANQWLLVPGAALAEHVRPAGFGTADGPGMFAFADPDRIRPILAEAGWRDVEITGARIDPGRRGRERRRRGGVPAHRVDGPGHARRGRRRHRGPRACGGPGRARSVCRRRGRAPGRRRMAGPGHRARRVGPGERWSRAPDRPAPCRFALPRGRCFLARLPAGHPWWRRWARLRLPTRSGPPGPRA